jgi:metallo-beta-lactamase family protein
VVRLEFHGAAGTVTGSKYLLIVNNEKVLIDCGMFQGMKELRQRNWSPMKFEPSEVEAIIVTHGHIDHVGFVPRLVRDGFNGKVYCTAPTQDIAAISLQDTAHIQMEDAEFRNKKGLTSHDVALPLFTDEDVDEALKLFTPVPFLTWTKLSDQIRFRYHIVGHLLGAASVEVEVTDGSRKLVIQFSGDIGRYHATLVKEPTEPVECDYLVCESTYGSRLHPDENPEDLFADLINQIIRNKSILLVPAFAVGRTQQIIFLIHELIEQKRIPSIDIHIDSPMAVAATDIYLKYHAYHAIDLDKLGPGSVLNGKNVHIHRKRDDSQDLNKLKGPAIIISSSGMLTGGRILHHLIQRLPDPHTVVSLVGFMADGTLGRKLEQGESMVYIHKQAVPVNAKIINIQALSGHADYSEILQWLKPISKPPKTVFITHGEPTEAAAMSEHIKTQRGWNTHIAVLDEGVDL